MLSLEELSVLFSIVVISDRCLSRTNKNQNNLLMSSLSSTCAELEDFIFGETVSNSNVWQ